MSSLEANVDVILIENKQLQDNCRALSSQLATLNQKYNQLLHTLQTQYSFMNDVELRMNLIMKRDKPLKKDLARIREQRNYLKEENKSLHQEKCNLNDERDRLSKENVWLLEQVELSRKVSKDMMNLYKANEGSSREENNDMGERAQALDLEKTRLEVEKQTLAAKVDRYEKDLKRSITIIEDLRRQVLKEQAKSEHLKGENNEMKRQLIQKYSENSSENEKKTLQLKFLQEQIKNLELENREREKSVSAPAVDINNNNGSKYPSSNQVTFDLMPKESNRPLLQRESTKDEPAGPPIQEDKNCKTKPTLLQPPTSELRYDYLHNSAKSLIEAKRHSPSRRSPSPVNPFFPISTRHSGAKNAFQKVPDEENSILKKQNSSLGAVKEHEEYSLGSPEKSTFLEQPTFLIQEAISSRKAMESLDTKIRNLENLF